MSRLNPEVTEPLYTREHLAQMKQAKSIVDDYWIKGELVTVDHSGVMRACALGAVAKVENLVNRRGSWDYPTNKDPLVIALYFSLPQSFSKGWYATNWDGQSREYKRDEWTWFSPTDVVINFNDDSDTTLRQVKGLFARAVKRIEAQLRERGIEAE